MGALNFYKTVRKLVATSGVLQGFIWASFSLIVITLHYSRDIIFEEDQNFLGVISQQLYYEYVKGTINGSSYQVIMTSSQFIAFAQVYFILHVAWFIVSVSLFFETEFKQKDIIWIIISYLIVLLDIVTTILLGHDFYFCYEASFITEQSYCYVSKGILLLTSSRGFLLSICNVLNIYIIRWILFDEMERFRRMTNLLQYHNKIPRPQFKPPENVNTSSVVSQN